MLRAQVIKEVRATFSAKPGAERLRPGARTASPNVFLAGDWTQSGWPATMEGAVRSGYLAAEAVCAAAGRPQRFLIDN
jgi:zeta-carotene desaturase